MTMPTFLTILNGILAQHLQALFCRIFPKVWFPNPGKFAP
jgi:hypothetical protein